MGHDRDKDTDDKLRCEACEQDGKWTDRHGLAMQQARFAIEGNPDMRAQYEADPALFMQRFGVAPQGAFGVAPQGAQGAVSVDRSKIHGEGVFAQQRFRKGETIAVMLNGQRDDVSPVASKVNHAEAANALPVTENGELVLKAVEDVGPGREVVSNYPFPGKR